ncbi:MAG: CotH kinase family protein, partial [Deltaproteobacteria bacterium]|nr:CotH kinase family protein [Deltaproteobacteria bacterium]
MLPFLLACTGDPVIAPGRDGVEATIDSAELVPGTDTGDESGQERDEHGCVDLYHQDHFPAYELMMDDWGALEADYARGVKDYHPATLSLQGETVDVQVRLKGNPSFSWLGGKLQLVVSFNEDDPDARFHGQRKIVLDATWYEPTLLRERLGWWVMRQRGEMPASCANNATLAVNGEFYGTYAHLEYLDHEYLERVFGDAHATGTLWKYGSEAKTNIENADYAKLETFWRADDVATMESLGDVREWTRAWAAESVMGDDDGYWCCAHNFYLYDHPDEGMLFVPWDWDDTFEITPYDSNPVTGYSTALFQQEHFVAVTSDADWRSVYVDELEAMNEAMDPSVTVPLLLAWDAE